MIIHNQFEENAEESQIVMDTGTKYAKKPDTAGVMNYHPRMSAELDINPDELMQF